MLVQTVYFWFIFIFPCFIFMHQTLSPSQLTRVCYAILMLILTTIFISINVHTFNYLFIYFLMYLSIYLFMYLLLPSIFLFDICLFTFSNCVPPSCRKNVNVLLILLLFIHLFIFLGVSLPTVHKTIENVHSLIHWDIY